MHYYHLYTYTSLHSSVAIPYHTYTHHTSHPAPAPQSPTHQPNHLPTPSPHKSFTLQLAVTGPANQPTCPTTRTPTTNMTAFAAQSHRPQVPAGTWHTSLLYTQTHIPHAYSTYHGDASSRSTSVSCLHAVGLRCRCYPG